MNKYCIIVLLCVAFFFKFVHPSIEFYDDIDPEDQEECDYVQRSRREIETDFEQNEVCFNEDTESLTFIYKPKSDVHILGNETSGTASITNFINKITCLHNGKTGFNVVFNYKLRKSFFFLKETNTSITNFNAYFQNLPTPKKFYEYARRHGTPFGSNSIPRNVEAEMQNILQSLDKSASSYPPRCNSLSKILGNFETVTTHFYTSLEGFSEIMTPANVQIPGDLKWLLNFYKGLNHFLSVFEEGLDDFIDREVRLDFTGLMNQKTGFHVLSHIFKQMVNDFDEGIVLGRHVTSVSNIFSLLDQLGGQYGNSFDDYVHVLAVMTNFLDKKTSLEELERILFRYCSNPGTSGVVVRRNWKSAVEALLNTIENLDLDSNLPYLKFFLEGVRDDEWNCEELSVTKISEMIMRLEAPCDRSLVAQILNLLKDADCVSKFQDD